MHWKSALKIGIIAIVAVAAVRWLASKYQFPGSDLLA